MRWTGNRLYLAAGLVASLMCPSVAFAASTITGTVSFDGKAPAMKQSRIIVSSVIASGNLRS